MISSFHPAQSLLNAAGHPQVASQSSKATSTPLVIAIFRQAETGGTAVAHEVGKSLGWPVYDHELIQRIAADLGVRADLLASVDEHHSNWLREAFERMMAVPFVSESTYVHRLVKILLALGANGNCVIVGRGAGFVLPEASTYRVRLMAPLDYRVDARRVRLNTDEPAARASVQEEDRERIRFVRDHFHRDSEAAEHFDLILNVARFSPDDCAGLIIDGLRRRQAHGLAQEPAAEG